MDDRFIHLLFEPFTRDVGNPARQSIKSYADFQSFVEANSGKEHCFCEVYSRPYTRLASIFYDFDGPAAYEEAKGFYTYLIHERQVPVIPLVSGKKGVHLHAFLRPQTFKSPEDAKASLSATAIALLFNYSKKPLTSIDTHVIGDVRRFCRIPNTLRADGNNWCTYLPPDWVHMSELDIVNHMKTTHTYDYNMPPRALRFIDSVPDEAYAYMAASQAQTQVLQAAVSPPEQSILQYLQGVMRPCLFKAFTQSNPRHHTRVASVIDLKGAGFTQADIEGFISKLHWIDYDPTVTHVQVSHIFGKTYIPYSCRTLERLGVCDGKHL